MTTSVCVSRNCDQTMKIAHINFAVEKSIDAKIVQMAAAAVAQELPIEFVSFSLSEDPVREANYSVYRLPFSWLGRKWAAKVQWPFRLTWAANRLSNQGYDIVVLRYPKLPIGWQYFLRKMSACIITEHHTDELAEIRGEGGFLRRVAVCLEKHLRRQFLPQVQGVIGVTTEIIDLVRRDTPHVPFKAISNGIEVDKVPFSRHVAFDGVTLRLVFVASYFAPWHGLDRLLKGLSLYTGKIDIRLMLIGVVPAEYMDRIATCGESSTAVTINCVGPVYGSAIDAYYREATVGIASLALHRNGMKQACTLKAREYIARGLPFVYAYEDPDVPADADFVHRIPDDETPVDIDDLVAFATRLRNNPNCSSQMRDLGAKKLDWNCKVNKMSAFARDTLNRCEF